MLPAAGRRTALLGFRVRPCRSLSDVPFSWLPQRCRPHPRLSPVCAPRSPVLFPRTYLKPQAAPIDPILCAKYSQLRTVEWPTRNYHRELTNARRSLCHAGACPAAPSVGRCSSGLCAAFGREGFSVPTASDARWLPSAVRTSAWRSVSVRQRATAAQKCTADCEPSLCW